MRTKRSRQITLVLLASTGIALAGCDNQQNSDGSYSSGMTDEAVFKTQADCERLYSRDECIQNELVAQQQYMATAPKFTSREECEREYGFDQCASGERYTRGGSNQTPSHHGGPSVGQVFVPLMLGYMMGAANRQPAPVHYGPTPRSCTSSNDRDCRNPSSGGGGSRPVYSGSTFVGTYARGGSTVSTPSSSSFSSARGSSVSSGTARGGFGASAAGHAGGGS